LRLLLINSKMNAPMKTRTNPVTVVSLVRLALIPYYYQLNPGASPVWWHAIIGMGARANDLGSSKLDQQQQVLKAARRIKDTLVR
jgi:hypothetical protein